MGTRRSRSSRCPLGRRLLVPAALLALCAGSSSVLANGRPPAPLQVTFDPGSDLTVAVGNTFGLALSSDGGRRFSWVCEQAIGYAGIYDPVVSVTRTGSLWVTTYLGLARSTDGGCSWSFAAGLDGYQVSDLSVAEGGLLATTSIAGLPNGVFRSTDAGASFVAAELLSAGGAPAEEDLFTSVRHAPSDPTVAYAVGLTVTPASKTTVYKSVSGGQSFAAVAGSGLPQDRSFVVAAIAPDDPALLLLRVEPKVASAARADAIYRSGDGGATFQPVLSVPGALTGLAFGSASAQLWASTRDALYRSIDAGKTFTTVATAGQKGVPHLLCLTPRGGLLYVCADPGEDGYAAARSADSGATFSPLLSYTTLAGPLACPADSVVTSACGDLWPALAGQLGAPVVPVPPSDGGPVSDGGVAGDTAPVDAGTGTDVARGGGGGCTVASGASSGARPAGSREAAALGAMLLLLGWVRRHRRRD